MATVEHGNKHRQKMHPVSHSSHPSQQEKGIHITKSHKNLLHEKLHVPDGQPIPESKLKRAEHSNSTSLRKEAQFADNAKKFKH